MVECLVWIHLMLAIKIERFGCISYTLQFHVLLATDSGLKFDAGDS
jgi:hypothetical protein